MKDRIWAIFKSILWIIFELALFVIFFVPLSGLLTWLALNTFPGSESYSIAENPVKTLVFDYMPLFLASIISLYVVHSLIFKRDWETTGFTKKWYSRATLVAGMLAFFFLALSFLCLYAVGFMQIDEIDFNPALFFGFVLLFLVQSSFEEIVSRSFMIPSIATHSNVWVALFISSSVFAILHVFNANITVLSTLNIFLAGLLLGLLYLRYESIWPAISFHVAWNFFQGSFFGFEVSGNEVYSYLDTSETGPDLLTGGPFGLEGSLICTLLLTTYSAYLLNRWSKSGQFVLLSKRAVNS